MRPQIFINFYKEILVTPQHMTNDDFERFTIHESNQKSTFFYITAKDKQLARLLLNFSYLQSKLEQEQAHIRAFQSFGGERMINVFYTNNSMITNQYIQWLNENSSKDFIERMKFSSLVPFLFLDVNSRDTLFCQGTVNPSVINIISKYLSNGYIFVNEPDIKKGKENYNFGSNNLCVLNYKEPSGVPPIQLFDKVICIAPSTEDGFLYDYPSEWSVGDANKKHDIQKEYLRSSLKKLKPSGICVYSTYSINPVENEAVVNEVLNELNGSFFLVDRRNMYDEIGRLHGLAEWKIEGFHYKTKNTNNINYCMRFYSHLIHSDSTFVAVIMRHEEEESDINAHIQVASDEFVDKNVFKKVPQNIINNIIEKFGFYRSEFTKISFFHSDMYKKTIFYVSKHLAKVIEKGNKHLKICQLGSSAFFFNKEDSETVPVPYYDCLPSIAKYPSKRLICIDFDNFEKLVESLSISTEELPDQIQNNLKLMEEGGIFIKINKCDFKFGAYLHDSFVKLEMTSEKARKMFEKVKDIKLFQEIGIGNSNFGEIRKNNYFYVDKTEFIREWWKQGPLTTLITRPRRFGKSLTLSMVKYFFSTEYANEKDDIFKGTKIWFDEKMMKIQGTFPVISMSFGKCKFQDVNSIVNSIKQEIVDATRSFKQVLLQDADKLDDNEINFIKSINYEMNDEVAFNAINKICMFINRVYNKNVIILLDEYDSPILNFLENRDDIGLTKVKAFLMNFFCSTFKENEFLQRALIVGITQISNESIFSGFNNMQVIKTSSYQYSTTFGFTLLEVQEALKKYGLGLWKELIITWYDGYCFGSTTQIFNPWSITKFLYELREPECYWLKTSDNSLVEDFVRQCSSSLSSLLIDLLQNHEVYISIQEVISLNEIYARKPEAIISLLVASGYISITGKVMRDNISFSMLKIPNFEIEQLFNRIITTWFEKSYSYSDFINDFIQCDLKSLNINLNQILLDCIGTFDSVECFFHGLCLNMVIELRDRFDILSNSQRLDIIFIPKDITKDNKAYIIEFKYRNKLQNCKKETKTVLLELVQEALQQSDDKCYYQDLIKRGIEQKNIVRYAMVFYDLECLAAIQGVNNGIIHYD